MTTFGTAMAKTGTANFLANHLGHALASFGPQGMLWALFVLTILLTQPMSNAAAALVVLPIALDAAGDLGANPRTFAIAVMLAASVSFITPLEPSCLLVYGPGKYRFMDFVKVGLGLTVLLSVLVLWLIPRFWPLMPPP
jgi:di/tricarboxylate transporter